MPGTGQSDVQNGEQPMKTNKINMKTYIINLFARLGGASRPAWTCHGVAPLRAGRMWILPALIAVLNLMLAGRVTAQTFTTLHSFTAPDLAPTATELIRMPD